MSFLIHATDAINEWGFYENTRFSRTDADEFLRELFLYILQHNRKKWSAYPVYTLKYNTERHDLFTVVHHHEIYTYWHMIPVRENHLNIHFDMLHRLQRITVLFKGKDPTEYKCTVLYSTNCQDQTGFYYINIETFVTRCSCWKECIDRIDSINEHIDSIMETSRLHNRLLSVIRHLTHEAKRCSDAVHLKAMRSKITLLWSDIRDTPYPGPRPSEQ